MMDKVMCPYCPATEEHPEGVEMREAHNIGHGEFEVRYYCPECSARSTLIEDEDLEDARIAARSAAMQRFVPALKPMTWDEFYLKIKSAPVWMENKEVPAANDWVLPDEPEEQYPVTEEDQGIYGVEIRAWSRRPTDAEREAVAWG